MPVQLTTPWRRDDRRGGDEETDGFPRRTYEASLDLDHQLDDARRRAPNWQTVLWEFREPFAAACARLGPVSTLRWIVWREGGRIVRACLSTTVFIGIREEENGWVPREKKTPVVVVATPMSKSAAFFPSLSLRESELWWAASGS